MQTTEQRAKQNWDRDADIRYRCSSFHAYLNHLRGEETAAFVGLHRKVSGCSYKEALFTLSKRFPHLFN